MYQTPDGADPRTRRPVTPPQWQQRPEQTVYRPQQPEQPAQLPAQYQPQPYAPPQHYQPPQYGQYPQVAPKSPAAGLIVSVFLPGVGSMMAGKTGKGIGILAGWLIGGLLCLAVVGFFIVPVFWIWGLVAGYQDAVAWNRAHGIVS